MRCTIPKELKFVRSAVFLSSMGINVNGGLFAGNEKMVYCVICKEKTEKRYKIMVEDTLQKNGFENYICRECFNTLLKSHYNKGIFKISRLIGWIRRKDRWRY